MKKTVVLGAGNELLGDEGVGVHAVRILHEELPLSHTDIEVIDGGTSPDICHLIQGAYKLVIVDAVKGGFAPGTIYRFTPDQIAQENIVTTSVHQVGILEALKMMELMGDKPEETVIIGIEPSDIAVGLELSQELLARMPEFIQIICGEIGLSLDTN
ncbi:MAG TPA: hydrogenase maturation protease [Dehalococcoidia bacterium]|nr:hydrogenase maturation protease [Dehalococcoidia bacterium]